MARHTAASASAGDHWLGLDHISSLTSQPGLRSELRVDLLDADNHTLQAHYDDFRVGREEQFYPLTLGRYSGNAGECWEIRHPCACFALWALQPVGRGTLAAGQRREGSVGPWSPRFPATSASLCALGRAAASRAPALGSQMARQRVGGLGVSWPATHTATTLQGTRSGAWATRTTRRAVASARWTVTMTAAHLAWTAPRPSPAAAMIAQALDGGTAPAAVLTSTGCGRSRPGPPQACAGPLVTTSPPCAPACCACTPLLLARSRPPASPRPSLIKCLSLAVLAVFLGVGTGEGPSSVLAQPGCSDPAHPDVCPSRTGLGKSRRPCSPTFRPEARSPHLRRHYPLVLVPPGTLGTHQSHRWL